MSAFQTILAVAAIVTHVAAQWPIGAMNRNNQQRTDNQNGRNPRLPSQQTASPGSRWNYNSPGYGHGQQRPRDQRQRDRDLVDYPFTVEYVNRRKPTRLGGSMSTSRGGIGAFSQSQNDDENLIDYPFTVEFVSKTNSNPPEKEKIPDHVPQSSNQHQHSFQSTTQQQHQRYQPCNHHYH